jgi:hypothetical protein
MQVRSWQPSTGSTRVTFDVRDLLPKEGIDDDLRRAFIVYLISHDRPIAEVLVPRRKDIAQEFAQGFDGMTAEAVTLDDLLAVRETLVAAIAGGMPEAHKKFLLGFKRGEPDWPLLGVPHAADLPAVKWKQLNLDRLSPQARARLVTQLEETLRKRH